MFALITSYVIYSRESGEKAQKIIRELKRHINDFARVNFDAKQEAEDFRVIKLLDFVSIPPDSSILWAEAKTRMEEIKKLQLVFQLWHSTIKHKVHCMTEKDIYSSKKDLEITVDDFALLFSNYVEEVAEKILLLLNKVPVLERDQQIKAILNVYRENLGHLRERVNSFLIDLHESNYNFAVGEVKALRTELVFRLS